MQLGGLRLFPLSPLPSPLHADCFALFNPFKLKDLNDVLVI